jgi:hypothetical protein
MVKHMITKNLKMNMKTPIKKTLNSLQVTTNL